MSENRAGWPAFWSATKRVITEAWPEVGGPKNPIYRETQAMRSAWRELYDKEELAAPWVVVEIPPTRQVEDNGACNVVYQPEVRVYYVAEMGVEGTKDVAAYVQDKLSDLEAVLVDHRYTEFQLLYQFTYDLSAQNPANAAFIPDNLPLFAGCLSFRAKFGYVVERGTP